MKLITTNYMFLFLWTMHHVCPSYMKMTLPTSVTQDFSPVVVFLCWISKFSFLIPLSYQQHMGKNRISGLSKIHGAYSKIKPTTMASQQSILTSPDIHTTHLSQSHWFRAHLEGQGCGSPAHLSQSPVFPGHRLHL